MPILIVLGKRLLARILSLSSQVSSLSGTIPSEWINRVILILAYQGASLSYLIDQGENRANLIAPSQYQQTKISMNSYKAQRVFSEAPKLPTGRHLPPIGE